MEKDNFSENGGDNELAKAWEGMGQEFEEEGLVWGFSILAMERFRRNF